MDLSSTNPVPTITIGEGQKLFQRAQEALHIHPTTRLRTVASLLAFADHLEELNWVSTTDAQELLRAIEDAGLVHAFSKSNEDDLPTPEESRNKIYELAGWLGIDPEAVEEASKAGTLPKLLHETGGLTEEEAQRVASIHKHISELRDLDARLKELLPEGAIPKSEDERMVEEFLKNPFPKSDPDAPSDPKSSE
jgi:hypothetical protein